MGVALPSLAELLLTAERRALHIELRDEYARTPLFDTWKAGKYDEASRQADAEWAGLLAPLVAKGGDLRRLRVVSEPITDYVRYEYEGTPAANLAAGETVRWLRRGDASDLRFPGNDFWLIDDALLFNLNSGAGEWLGTQPCDDADVAAFCMDSFEAAWSRAIDHADYRPV